MEIKKNFPVPGIEPEPPGWEPGILATRPYRRHAVIFFVFLEVVE